MRKEKTLDEALAEMDKWTDRVYDNTKGMTNAEMVEYFKGAKARLEKSTGKKLNLKVRRRRRVVAN